MLRQPAEDNQAVLEGGSLLCDVQAVVERSAAWNYYQKKIAAAGEGSAAAYTDVQSGFAGDILRIRSFLPKSVMCCAEGVGFPVLAPSKFTIMLFHRCACLFTTFFYRRLTCYNKI